MIIIGAVYKSIEQTQYTCAHCINDKHGPLPQLRNLITTDTIAPPVSQPSNLFWEPTYRLTEPVKFDNGYYFASLIKKVHMNGS